MKKLLGIAVVVVLLALTSVSLQAVEYSLYWEATPTGSCDNFIWIGEHDTQVKITKTRVHSSTLAIIGPEVTIYTFSASQHNYTYNEPCANYTYMYKAYLDINGTWKPAKKHIYFFRTADYMNPGVLCPYCIENEDEIDTK